MTPDTIDSTDEERLTASEVERDAIDDLQADATSGDSSVSENQDAGKKSELLDAMLKGERVTIEWDGEDVADDAFAYRINVEKVILPNAKSLGDGAFYKCSHLNWVEMPAVERIGRIAFDETGSLTTIILGNKEHVVSLDKDVFMTCLHINGQQHDYFNPHGERDCFIYVPDRLVDAYKTSSDWAEFADQIKPLSAINY